MTSITHKPTTSKLTEASLARSIEDDLDTGNVGAITGEPRPAEAMLKRFDALLKQFNDQTDAMRRSVERLSGGMPENAEAKSSPEAPDFFSQVEKRLDLFEQIARRNEATVDTLDATV